MKRIKQVNESKELIFNALMELLTNRKLEDIKLSEIAEEAGVGRMTLYRHFKEKEDILNYMYEKNFDKLIDEVLQKKGLSLFDLVVFRFKALKNSPYIDTLIENNKIDRIFQTKGINDMAKFRYLFPETLDPYDFAIIAAGFDAITTMWIKNGMNESYVEMAHKTIHMIDRILEK